MDDRGVGDDAGGGREDGDGGDSGGDAGAGGGVDGEWKRWRWCGSRLQTPY